MPTRPTATIRIALADDHPLVLDGLEQLFRLEPDMEVVARCHDGEEALSAVRDAQPDVLVLDLLLPRRDGLEVLAALQDEELRARVLVLTASLDDDQLLRAVRRGARGVVLKDMASRLILEAVRAVHAGEYWLEKGLGGRALQRLLQRDNDLTGARRLLTARELEIVGMVARGLRNRAIGEHLHITEGTVKIHLHNIFEKLGLTSRLQLALWAQQKGVG